MLRNKRYWVFDMDGTLTIAQHDFEAIRRQLELPPGQPILEAIARLSKQEAAAKLVELDTLELHIAVAAEPQDGAVELLTRLSQKGFRLGILTRNSLSNALTTLQACGLADYFAAADIISRGCAAPKPDPAGIYRLMGHWTGRPAESVMVGDYLYDMQCGRGAGVTTVYFDPDGSNLWNDHADLVIRSLNALAEWV